MERSSVNLETLKNIPGYRVILKTVLHSQIQQLVEQLSKHTEEEVVFLTASLSDGTISHIGSGVGKEFLHENDDMKSRFLAFCLKRHHEITFNQQSKMPLLPSCQGRAHVPLKIPNSSISANERHSPYAVSLNRHGRSKRRPKSTAAEPFQNNSDESVTNENDKDILESVSIELADDHLDDADDADNCDRTDNGGLSDASNNSGMKSNDTVLENVIKSFQSKSDGSNVETPDSNSSLKVESMHTSGSNVTTGSGSSLQMKVDQDSSADFEAPSQNVHGGILSYTNEDMKYNPSSEEWTSNNITQDIKYNPSSTVKSEDWDGSKSFLEDVKYDPSNAINSGDLNVSASSIIFSEDWTGSKFSKEIRHRKKRGEIPIYANLTPTQTQCPYCERNYCNNANLKRHIRQHEGIYPYQCEACKQRFTDPTIYKRHVTNTKKLCYQFYSKHIADFSF